MDKIIKLLCSNIEEDRLIGIELCKNLDCSKLKLIFDSSETWKKPKDQYFLNSITTKTGLIYRLKHGYIAYNGCTWWFQVLEDASRLNYDTSNIL